MKPKRKSIPPKIRFEVFHRDGFTCQYCGSSVPDVVLELDHIQPFSKGGSNDIDNLLTACTSCNRGKAAKKITAAPLSLAEKTKVLNERKAQLEEYHKALQEKVDRDNKYIDIVQEVFSKRFDDKLGFTESFRNSIRRNFLPHLDIETLINAAHTAADRCREAESASGYFCGICWNKIKGRNSY